MNPAQAIIQKFGGVRAMARALKHKHPTRVQYWATKGYIPPQNIDAVRRAALEEGITLDPSEFIEVAA